MISLQWDLNRGQPAGRPLSPKWGTPLRSAASSKRARTRKISRGQSGRCFRRQGVWGIEPQPAWPRHAGRHARSVRGLRTIINIHCRLLFSDLSPSRHVRPSVCLSVCCLHVVNNNRMTQCTTNKCNQMLPKMLPTGVIFCVAAGCMAWRTRGRAGMSLCLLVSVDVL